MTDLHPPSRDIATPIASGVGPSPSDARRLGLVVGIDSYADSGIPNLKAAIADARAIHTLMVDKACGGFDPEQTQLLVGRRATERAIKTALSHLDKHALSDDEIWIYFAGHGVLDRGKHLILPFDADLRHPKASSVVLGDFLEGIRCQRKVVFLDCCHSGAVSGTRSVYSAEEVLRGYSGRGAATFCSSEEDEKSHELPGENRGAFSYWLERGLRGEADSDRDGVVSSGELWEFVRRKVEQDTRDRCGARQTPRFKFDGSGEFRLTRCAVRCVRAIGSSAPATQLARADTAVATGLPLQLESVLSKSECESLVALLKSEMSNQVAARVQWAANLAAHGTSDAIEAAASVIRPVLRGLREASTSADPRGGDHEGYAVVLNRLGRNWAGVVRYLADRWGLPVEIAKPLARACPGVPVAEELTAEQAAALVQDLGRLGAEAEIVDGLSKWHRKHLRGFLPKDLSSTHDGANGPRASAEQPPHAKSPQTTESTRKSNGTDSAVAADQCAKQINPSTFGLVVFMMLALNGFYSIVFLESWNIGLSGENDFLVKQSISTASIAIVTAALAGGIVARIHQHTKSRLIRRSGSTLVLLSMCAAMVVAWTVASSPHFRQEARLDAYALELYRGSVDHWWTLHCIGVGATSFTLILTARLARPTKA